MSMSFVLLFPGATSSFTALLLVVAHLFIQVYDCMFFLSIRGNGFSMKNALFFVLAHPFSSFLLKKMKTLFHQYMNLTFTVEVFDGALRLQDGIL